MKDTLIIQGRELSSQHLDFIIALIAGNPTWSRRKLSQAICVSWDWRNAKGALKDMACRTMLVKLDELGAIQLPARRQLPSNRMTQRTVPWIAHNDTPIESDLAALRPLSIEVIEGTGPSECLFSCLLSNYHYLGYRSSVGENMKYLVKDRSDRLLACLLFGSAAWKAGARDSFIGWDQAARKRHLHEITNNTRFLVLPWVRVPHLASHLLALITRQISTDWQRRYGHGVELIETFVEKARFRGSCYKAANWIHVGDTQGRSRNDRDRSRQVAVKSIYLYPLRADFSARLSR